MSLLHQKNEETIYAEITPRGRGAVSVIRLSGPEAIPTIEFFTGISRKEMKRKRLMHAFFKDKERVIDEVVLSVFFSPHSYTGEDVVELSLHGNPLLVSYISSLLKAKGLRQAMPGEFTYRAYKNGKVDLMKAEAINDIVRMGGFEDIMFAVERLEGKWGDFIEKILKQLKEILIQIEAFLEFGEPVDIGFIRQTLLKQYEKIDTFLKRIKPYRASPIPIVVLAGPTNSGKSTLFNYLLGLNRVIVSNIPGTTRDVIDMEVEIDGSFIRLVDTAGIFDAREDIDRAGIDKAYEFVNMADLVLWIFDGSRPFKKWREIIVKEGVIVANKKDLGIDSFWYGKASIEISAKNGLNVDKLATTIKKHINSYLSLPEREYNILVHMRSKLKSVGNEVSLDIVGDELERLLTYGKELTTGSEGVREAVFNNFCIGK